MGHSSIAQFTRCFHYLHTAPSSSYRPHADSQAETAMERYANNRRHDHPVSTSGSAFRVMPLITIRPENTFWPSIVVCISSMSRSGLIRAHRIANTGGLDLHRPGHSPFYTAVCTAPGRPLGSTFPDGISLLSTDAGSVINTHTRRGVKNTLRAALHEAANITSL